MNRLYIVLTDIWHAFIGILTIYIAKHYGYLGGLLFFYPFLGALIPLVIMGIYFTYQSLDDDDPIERLGDLVEYAIGMIIGSVISI
jgi:hypothetical protein